LWHYRNHDKGWKEGTVSLFFALAIFGQLPMVAFSTNPAPADDASRRIIAKAIEAHGGAANLKRHTAFSFVASGTATAGEESLPLTLHCWYRAPDRLKYTITAKADGKELSQALVLAGDRAWGKRFNGPMRRADEQELREARETARGRQLQRLYPLLEDPSIKLSAVGEAKVNGRAAVGVRVESAGHDEVRFFFDKESGLLVKSEEPCLSFDKKKSWMEGYFTNYKLVEGVRYPFEVKNVWKEEKRALIIKIRDFRVLDTIDDAEFKGP
jgi:hypothetical protein